MTKIIYPSTRRLFKNASPSDWGFVEHVTKHPGCPVIGWVRESWDHGNLADQVADLKERMADLGIVAEYVYAEVGSSSIHAPRTHQSALYHADQIGGIVVAIDLTRHLRGSAPWSERPGPLTVKVCMALNQLRHDARVGTLMHPSATASQIRSEHTKRGHRAKGNKGGGDHSPGWKKRRIRKAMRMFEKDASIGQVAKRFGVCRATAQYWQRLVYEN